MTETMLEIILRRDRIIVAAALAALTALAWTYVLWLAADMDMGAMEMTGFRMVPAGIGIMAPAPAPWQTVEFLCQGLRKCPSSWAALNRCRCAEDAELTTIDPMSRSGVLTNAPSSPLSGTSRISTMSRASAT